MAAPKIADLLRIQRRYLRSAHLQRDFQDPASLDGYILTPAIKANFDRIRHGMVPGSGQRAWRVTGDYGSGKSSFARSWPTFLPAAIQTNSLRFGAPSTSPNPKPASRRSRRS